MSDIQNTQQEQFANVNVQHERSMMTKVFLGLLASVGVLYGVVLAYHVSTPLPGADASQAHWLEQCRQICADYGLVYTGHIKDDAEAYLEVMNSQKLSAPLEDLLSDASFLRAESEDHPLIGKVAPDFTLVNAEDKSVTLSSIRRESPDGHNSERGPIVLVFYYGYNCPHCVAQLVALQKDLEYFHELGAEVVAISADTPEYTRKKYAEYGGFTFPVLSDPDYEVSEQWGVYVRPSNTVQEDLLHGTFVLDRNGTVLFSNRGYEPFTDNQSLLRWIADQPRR